MRRFRYRELRGRLPALARAPLSRRAERYLREHFPEVAKEPKQTAVPKRRRDGVREYRLTRLARAGAVVGAGRKTPVPYLRMSGQWMETFGFCIDSRVFITAEPGRLVMTLEDPAIVPAASVGE